MLLDIKDQLLFASLGEVFSQGNVADLARPSKRHPARIVYAQPFIWTSGGMRSGSSTRPGSRAQSIITRFRLACVYPSTLGKRISYYTFDGTAWT